jgi:hypothetical protein
MVAEGRIMDDLHSGRIAIGNNVIDRQLRQDAAGLIARVVVALVFVGLILVECASGQTVVPPPGFSPGETDVSTPNSSTDAETYMSSGNGSEVFDGASSLAYPNRSRLLPRSGRQFGDVIVPAFVFDHQAPLPKFWLRSEALLWWSKGSPLSVPVVTAGSSEDSVPGAIGQPGTSVLLGNQDFALPSQGGGRFTLGFSFNPEQTWGVEGTYFFLANTSTSQSISASGGPNSALLSFPYFNPITSQEDASPIALPGYFAGYAAVSVQSLLQGADVNLLHNIMNNNAVRMELLGGFRYVNFQEELCFRTDSPDVDPNPPGFFHTYDQFIVNNNFYGAQLGVRASYDRSQFFANATGKMALGSTFEQVSVDGGTYTNIGGFASAPGDYLSQPSNIGSTTREQFAVVPELNLNVGVRLAPWVSMSVGYSFLYISSVARPGNQAQHVINPNQSFAISNDFPTFVAGPSLPSLSVQNTSFWAQGLNFALEFRF